MRASISYSVAALAVLLHVTVCRAAADPVQAKLWVVSVAEASNAVFPAPSAAPDATFTTEGIAYIGQQRAHGSSLNCFTIGQFVDTCGSPSSALMFSKLPNPNLPGDAAVTPSTLMAGGLAFGVMIELTGTVYLSSGQAILIYHDDGVSLKIDGTQVPGFSPGVGVWLPETTIWGGATGTHSFDLLYGNVGGQGAPDGAWLLFQPYLYTN